MRGGTDEPPAAVRLHGGGSGGAGPVFAALAYADTSFPPVWQSAAVWLAIGAFVVLLVAGLSFRCLRKAARERRLDREAAERWAKLKALEQEESR
jgi:peptidoglycan/LPS O-acetylase OafA/YrhL